MMRLNKFLSDAGLCSRRGADDLITAGRVTVNGQPAELGMKVEEDADIRVDSHPVKGRDEKVYLAYHKPPGIVCTFEPREKHNLNSVLHYPVRVTYAGRLDKESEGLLLLTNDGYLIDRIMRARNFHEKEYHVEVDRDVDADFLKQMSGGLYLPELEVKTRPCQVMKTGRRSFTIILTQGLNRQIRRMCEVLSFHVVKLVRVRVMNIQLGGQKSGICRELTREELIGLRRELEKGSYEQEGTN